MSLTFSRSMRAIRSDSPYPSLWALLLVGGLILAWMAWFFLARITIYEISTAVRAANGQITAEFPAESLGRIRDGQPAILRVNGQPNEGSQTVPAIVMETAGDPGNGRIQVKLAPSGATTGRVAYFENGAVNQVEIEVEKVSPATLVLRTSEKYINTGTTAPSPR